MKKRLLIHQKRAEMSSSRWYWATGFMVFLFIIFLQPAFAQEEADLHLVAVDTSAFPIVRITLLTGDANSAPADISELSLRENGAPITDLTFNHVPSGVDVTFVMDANFGFGEVDEETGLTRQEETLDSIRRFAKDYMNPDGLDTVSIVVPDDGGQTGQFLIQEASTVEEIEMALSSYDPQHLGPTPLNAMLVLALEQAQERMDNGRYQALLLMTDGRRLDQQLSYPQLTAQANDANVPVYGVILGESADAHEIDNVTRLSDPTRAFFVHLSDPEAADPIYQIWQDQSNPVQVEYRSRQRQSGRSQLTLNLGSALVSTSFDLELADPKITLSLDELEIHRAGTAPDTALDALQPAVQPLSFQLMWPDGNPRMVTAVMLIVDGQPYQLIEEWQSGDPEQISFHWDISQIDEGSFELAVQITGELGYTGTSDPVPVNITVERPELPTPVPTVEPQEPVPDTAEPLEISWQMVASVGVVFLLIVVYFILRRRKRLAGAVLEEEDRPETIAADHETDGIVWAASLDPLLGESSESIPIDQENMAIGSHFQNVQIVLNDTSVSRLHARIRRQGQTYWLFDEGGAEGTFLNYDRLGLAPQELNDGDMVKFGTAAYRFTLRQIVTKDQ